MKKQLFTFLMLGVTTLFVACKKEDVTYKIYNPSEIMYSTLEQRLTENGWKEFCSGHYAQAVDSFLLATQSNSLYSDAYNGLGWAYARLDSLEDASHYFTVCMVSRANGLVLTDACAGRSFVNLALHEYYKAIEDVTAVILNTGNYASLHHDYAFRHDPAITTNYLLLVMAESWFMLGKYNSCYTTLFCIDDTIEETTDPERLAEIIEELRQSL